MKRGAKIAALAVAAGLASRFAGMPGGSGALAQEIDLKMNKADYPLSQVRLGRQVWGPRLSRLDFENRVVMILTWCVTCPASTAFMSEMDKLYAKYKDRGLVVAAFQCRREPWIVEDNVAYVCSQIRPGYAVTRRGWVCPWPVEYMPWVAIFNERGEMVFAGNVPGVEKKLAGALDRAPDYMVGGPYEKLKETAVKIAEDRAHAGRHMAELRKLAAGEGDTPEKKEAVAMIERLERYAQNRFERADEEPGNLAERARICGEVAAWFEGDAIGEAAARRVGEIKACCDLDREQDAWRRYREAWEAFRSLPPAGDYAYSMRYTLSADPLRVARRRRVLLDFRLRLREIADSFPETYAGCKAVDDLAVYPPPPMTGEQAAARLKSATKLLREPKSPMQMHEGWLRLQEVLDGYASTDPVGDEAIALSVKVWEKQEAELSKGMEEYEAAEKRVREIAGRVFTRGGEMSEEEAAECSRVLKGLAESAGEGDLAAEITSVLERLRNMRKEVEVNL